MVDNPQNVPGYISFNQINSEASTYCIIVTLGEMISFTVVNEGDKNVISWEIKNELNVKQHK